MILKYEFYIAGKPEQVWKALVSPDGTKKIFNGSVIESIFKVGSPFKYVGPGIGGPDTVHEYGKILAFDPPRVFSHTYKVGEVYGPEHAEYESRVTYELEPLYSSTRLIVTHDHWAAGDPAYDYAEKHWWKILSAIKTLVETGRTLDVRNAERVTSGGA